MTKVKVLSTKKLKPSLVAEANEQGIAITQQEAIQIRPIRTKEKWDEIFCLLEKDIEYAVFTSSNAVTALKKYLNTYVNHLPVRWKIFCLSGKTKELLVQNEALFGAIEGTANDATALAHVMLDKGVKEVVFFCGNKRRDELPDILQHHQVRVSEVVVYETREAPFTIAEEFDAVLFFSPSGVNSFFSANQLKNQTVCFAIGQTTANGLEQVTKNKIFISKEPTQEALIHEVIQYYKSRVHGAH